MTLEKSWMKCWVLELYLFYSVDQSYQKYSTGSDVFILNIST